MTSSLRQGLETVYQNFSGKDQTQPRWDHNHKQTHPGLWLEKYLPEQSSEDTKGRAAHIRAVAGIRSPYTVGAAQLYSGFFQQWRATLHAYNASTRQASVDRRLIVGLGNESILETSISLHRTYGVPYIPGSALKGLAACYVQDYLGTKIKPTDTAYTMLFGNSDEAGYLIYFDALYIPGTGAINRAEQKQALHPDIITVHHPEYYRKTPEAPPADWDSPTPIPFLTATGTYLLALAAPDIPNATKRDQWINITFAILKEALQKIGVGAKTSSGYGKMHVEDQEYIR